MTEHFIFRNENEIVGYSNEALNGESGCLAACHTDSGETEPHEQGLSLFGLE